MKKIRILKEKVEGYENLLACSLGCALMIACSFIKIPFYPVAFSLQTFALFIIALHQPPKQAAGSVILYLMCATVGLPVFGGKSQPFWLFGKCGGYLVGFALSAYFTSKLSQKYSAFVAVLIGQGIVYLCGLLWLIPLFGFYFSFQNGVVCFLFSDLVKNVCAIALSKGGLR